jgi:exo-beta-1,3-glucanase (GH17 family)
MKTTLLSLLALGASTVSAFPSTMRHGHLHSTKRQDYGSGSTNTQWSDNGGSYGIAYDLMADDGSCRSASQIASDVGFFASQGYTLVRTYDVGCDVGALAAAISTQSGMKLFCGINAITNVAGDLGKLVSMVSPYWSVVDTVNIGNEVVNAGAASAGAVVAAIGQARGILGSAGYTGKIVTVDTFVAIMNNPELCTASDYCAANTYAFFDGNVAAEGAGAFVQRMQGLVSAAAGGKQTIITESGWPSCGSSNGAGVPGESQQAAAIASLKAAYASTPSQLVLFQGYNAKYKQPGAFGAEQCWGIYN